MTKTTTLTTATTTKKADQKKKPKGKNACLRWKNICVDSDADVWG